MTSTLTALWLIYMMCIPLSLSGMEIVSTVLLALLCINSVRNSLTSEPILKIKLSRPQHLMLFALGLIVMSWIISVLMNQANTVILEKDIEPLRRVLIIFFPFLITVGLEREGKSFPYRALALALLIGLCISTVYGYFYRNWAGDQRFSGSFSFAFTFGASLTMQFWMILLCGQKTGWKWHTKLNPTLIKYGIIGIYLLSILLTKTRAAWLALALSIPLAMWWLYPQLSKRRWAPALFLIILMTAMNTPMIRERLTISFNDTSMKERRQYAEGGLEIAKQSFPWGVGYKNPPRIMAGVIERLHGEPNHHGHSHNHWIETLAGLGVIAFMGWILMFGTLFYFLIRNRKDVSAVALLGGTISLFVLSFFDVIFQDAEMAHMTALFLGMCFLHFSSKNYS